MRLLLLGYILASMVSVGFAQSPPQGGGTSDNPMAGAKAASTKSAEPIEFETVFHDGSKLKLFGLETEVDVQTKYGRLSIPLSDIRVIELGFRYPEGVELEIKQAYQNLGSNIYEERDAAESRLIELGQYAFSYIKQSMKTETNEERKQRCETILKRLNSSLPDAMRNTKNYDLITTPELKLQGQLLNTTLKVRTKQFGEATLQLSEVKQFRSLNSYISNSTFLLETSKDTARSWTSWFDTKLDLDEDDSLSITATGVITFSVNGNQQFQSSPSGSSGIRVAPPEGLRLARPMDPQQERAMIAARQALAPNQQITYLSAGTLLGKIREDGEVFVVGSQFRRSKAAQSGRLYLLVVPMGTADQVPTGSYTVTVNAGE